MRYVVCSNQRKCNISVQGKTNWHICIFDRRDNWGKVCISQGFFFSPVEASIKESNICSCKLEQNILISIVRSYKLNKNILCVIY